MQNTTTAKELKRPEPNIWIIHPPASYPKPAKPHCRAAQLPCLCLLQPAEVSVHKAPPSEGTGCTTYSASKVSMDGLQTQKSLEDKPLNIMLPWC